MNTTQRDAATCVPRKMLNEVGLIKKKSSGDGSDTDVIACGALWRLKRYGRRGEERKRYPSARAVGTRRLRSNTHQTFHSNQIQF